MKAKVGLLCVLLLVVGLAGCQVAGGAAKPLIGITSVYDGNEAAGLASITVNFTYISAVAENGGVPVILPTIRDERIIERYVQELDGLVLVGGADIPPAVYGEEPHETVKEVPKQRYNFEQKLIAEWLKSGKPLLGICLGMQFANIVAGGSLIQDIPSQVGTKINHRSYHPVIIEQGGLLAEILGADRPEVYSSHHQAVKKLGKDLKIAARSEDGVIEALERTRGGFGLFVQWHPEAMKDKAHRNAIYGAMIRACTAKK
ncbi:MAG: gamma-glutamyl-gamma-aminobutyrate hydrolase family protein [Sedimentisphaerales bacterium]|nr:gamma-glutamyl-gamma-aminobutyrate hydrolase family protein [Sedimentisphaerales bacterium]